MNKLLTITLFALSGLLFSCGDDKKEDDPQPAATATPATKADLLTTKNWTLILREDITNNKTYPYDLQAACIKDNYVKFEKDGTYKQDEGATKCNASDQQTYVRNWAFTDNETRITINGQACEIIELSEARFKYKRTFTNSTLTQVDVYTYEHK